MSVYLALGDSIISDCFPGPGRGAAALVQANVDADFPEFNLLNRSRRPG